MSKNNLFLIPTEKFLSEETELGLNFIEDFEELTPFHEHPDILKELEKTNEHKKQQEEDKFKQLMDRIANMQTSVNKLIDKQNKKYQYTI
jgi:hypothetical protein